MPSIRTGTAKTRRDAGSLQQRAVKYSVGERHPWSAPGGSSLMHDDTANSDATIYTGPSHETVIDQDVERLGKFFGGLVPTMATVTVKGRNYLLGLSFGAEECPIPFRLKTVLYAWDADAGTIVSSYEDVPPRPAPSIWKLITLRARADLFRTTEGGAYFCALRRVDGLVDVLIPAITDRLIFILFGGKEFGSPREVFLDGADGAVTSDDSSPVLEPVDDIVATLPAWYPADAAAETVDKIPHWWVSKAGVVGIADPSIPEKRVVDLNDERDNPGTKGGETVDDSIAVGKKGVFVVTNQAIYRFAYRDGRIRRVWRHPYDAPDLSNAYFDTRRTTRGSGTSPTLLGDDYVAFADGGRKMGLVIVRQGAPTDELTSDCAESAHASDPYLVFGPDAGVGTEESGCENSIVGFSRTDPDGTSSWRLIVANLWGYVTPFSPIRLRSEGVQGIECVQVIDDDGTGNTLRCERVWADPINAGTVVPKLSLTDQVLYFYSFDVEDRENCCCWFPCRNRRTRWSLIGIQPELLNSETSPLRVFDYNVGTTNWFRSSKPTEVSREYDNAWGTMVLTGGGAAVAWWRGLRWIRDAPGQPITSSS